MKYKRQEESCPNARVSILATELFDEVRKLLLKCYVIPCKQGRWLHCDSWNKALLFDNDGKVVRMCGKDNASKFFTGEIEATTDFPDELVARTIVSILERQ